MLFGLMIIAFIVGHPIITALAVLLISVVANWRLLYEEINRL